MGNWFEDRDEDLRNGANVVKNNWDKGVDNSGIDSLFLDIQDAMAGQSRGEKRDQINNNAKYAADQAQKAADEAAAPGIAARDAAIEERNRRGRASTILGGRYGSSAATGSVSRRTLLGS